MGSRVRRISWGIHFWHPRAIPRDLGVPILEKPKKSDIFDISLPEMQIRKSPSINNPDPHCSLGTRFVVITCIIKVEMCIRKVTIGLGTCFAVIMCIRNVCILVKLLLVLEHVFYNHLCQKSYNLYQKLLTSDHDLQSSFVSKKLQFVSEMTSGLGTYFVVIIYI